MKVEIKNDGRYTRIYIDGQEIHRVVKYQLDESVGEAPKLILEVLPNEIEVRGDCEVEFIDSEKARKNAEGYRDFIKFIFGSK